MIFLLVYNQLIKLSVRLYFFDFERNQKSMSYSAVGPRSYSTVNVYCTVKYQIFCSIQYPNFQYYYLAIDAFRTF